VIGSGGGALDDPSLIHTYRWAVSAISLTPSASPTTGLLFQRLDHSWELQFIATDSLPLRRITTIFHDEIVEVKLLVPTPPIKSLPFHGRLPSPGSDFLSREGYRYLRSSALEAAVKARRLQ